ncbi:MAG: ABC transporter permease subunit, partial [bacterium]
LWSSLLITLRVTVMALLISVIAGSLIAFLFVQSRWLEMSLFPYAVLLQVTPIVAIAPLVIIWVNDASIALVMCATIVAIFPVISNTTLGLRSVDAGLLELFRMNKATRMQTLVFGLGRTMLPRFLSIHFYIWEFNVRDSTVLGLIGAGGLGLLVSEAVALFQWGRLATLLIAIVLMVAVFDWASRKIRTQMLGV